MKKFFYRRPLFFVSFVVMLGAIFGMWVNFEGKKNYDNSVEVYAYIIEAPDNCESLNHKTSFITLEYNKQKFVEKVGDEYCENIGKSQIKVRFDKKSNSLFFIGDTFDDQIAAAGVIFLFGIFIAYKGWKKE